MAILFLSAVFLSFFFLPTNSLDDEMSTTISIMVGTFLDTDTCRTKHRVYNSFEIISFDLRPWLVNIDTVSTLQFWYSNFSIRFH